MGGNLNRNIGGSRSNSVLIIQTCFAFIRVGLSSTYVSSPGRNVIIRPAIPTYFVSKRIVLWLCSEG
jgi:hypothetical protein